MNVSIVRNYLLVAVRNLVRHPLYSTINIAGLAVGLACSLLILLFVRDELSYDRWLPGGDRVYRLESTFIVPGREPLEAAQAPGPARAALLKDFGAEIENAVRLFQRKPTVDAGGRLFNDGLIEADPEFFSVFPLEFLAGSPDGALGDKHSLVLTESLARKYFGATRVLGHTLTLTRDKPETYRITGVVRDLPRNTHLDIGMIARFDPTDYTDRPWVAEQWTSVNTYTYLKLRHGDAAATIAARLKEFTDRNVRFDVAGIDGIAPSDLLKFKLQELTRIHLHSPTKFGFKPGGSITTVYTFSAIAALILFIACVNFMNLATARSLQRAREVALRKVHGASRGQLVVQFIGESVLVAGIALALALAATSALLPYYNAWLDKALALDFAAEPELAGMLLALALLVGVVGGSYPAFFLSRFRPAAVLKAGRASGDAASGRPRAALVLLQFTISIGLMAATLVVYSQWRFARDIDLGYDMDRLVVISPAGGAKLESRQDALRQELLRAPGLAALARASDTPPLSDSNNTLVKLPDVANDDLLVIETLIVDYDFFPTLGVTPVAGRLFSAQHAADVMPPDADKLETPVSVGVVLNRQAVKRLGFGDAQQAVGRTFQVSIGEDRYADATVVGVIDDLHMRSIHEEITPTIYYAGDDAKVFYSFVLRLAPGARERALAAVDRAWAGVYPEVPIQRSFVDEDFAKLYAGEDERVRMFAGFSGLAIIVACLGLFGLASYTADRRTREIGIRKVLGASNADVIRLLLWQFSRPVLFANLLAWPAAWYFLDRWLASFAYRVELSLAPFLAAGFAALLIAWGTVLRHARRVARTGAVVSLRYE
jgi:putative ABC transport system permease protein